MKLYIWELNQKQEKGSIIPVPDPKPGISPKMEDQDPTLNQDLIPITDMILAPEQEQIEAMYKGTESEARKWFNNSRSQIKPNISPKMEEQDPTLNQDLIPITYMILAPEQELIDSNLLAEDQNP